MEGYSIMDWLTLFAIIASIATTIVAIAGAILKNSRDTKAILREFGALSEKYDGLSAGLSKDLSKNHESLSEKNQAIKKDTGYIRDEMLSEKRSRESLYENVSNAGEILNKLDFMREVVHQNAELTAQNSRLNAEIVALKQQPADETNQKLLSAVSRLSRQLSAFEGYQEAEEIQVVLMKIQQELEEYTR